MILSGDKAKDDHLWSVNVPLYSTNNNSSSANLAILCDIDAEYVHFASNCFGSLADSTFLKAARLGFLVNFPRLLLR